MEKIWDKWLLYMKYIINEDERDYFSNPITVKKVQQVCLWWQKYCKNLQKITIECRATNHRVNGYSLDYGPHILAAVVQHPSINHLHLDCHFDRKIYYDFWYYWKNYCKTDKRRIRIDINAAKTNAEHYAFFSLHQRW